MVTVGSRGDVNPEAQLDVKPEAQSWSPHLSLQPLYLRLERLGVHLSLREG